MDADDLYGAPLERFVAERGALARALRASGRREEAAEILALRKPSVAAWAVNQLVRTHHGAVSELFDAGDALREAQADVVAGRGDGGGLRAATECERAAVDALVAAARGLLSSGGHEATAATIDRVADTMHAAALDEEARGLVRAGRLERELRHVGLGVGAPGPMARPAPKPAAPAKAKAGGTASTVPATAEKQAAGERKAQERPAREREAERAEARRAARIAEGEARRAADRAARAARVAEERRERAAQALRAAEEALSDARAEEAAAAEAHDRAREQLESA